MTEDNMDVQALLGKSADAAFLREMIGFAAQRLMDLEVGGPTGYGEKNPEQIMLAINCDDMLAECVVIPTIARPASLARNKPGSAFSTQPVEETINLSSTKPQQSGRVRRSQFTTLYTLQCIETRKLAVAHRQHRHHRASSRLKDEHGTSAPPITPYVSFLSSGGVPFLSGTASSSPSATSGTAGMAAGAARSQPKERSVAPAEAEGSRKGVSDPPR